MMIYGRYDWIANLMYFVHKKYINVKRAQSYGMEKKKTSKNEYYHKNII